MNAVAVIGAAAVGVLLGATGGGGSMLTVPLFVHVLGIEPKVAIAMSLPVVGLTSLAGVVGHWRAGHVDVRPALAIGVLAMAGAYAGARAAALLSDTMQLTLLGIVMVAAAWSLWRRSQAPIAPPEQAGPAPLALLVPIALGIGALTGVIGIGGGFLFVPALVLLARMPMARAAGTSLLIIVLNAAAGLVGYLGQVELPWPTILTFVAIAGAGALPGAVIVRAVPHVWLQRGFAVLLLGVATALVVQSVLAAG